MEGRALEWTDAAPTLEELEAYHQQPSQPALRWAVTAVSCQVPTGFLSEGIAFGVCVSTITSYLVERRTF